MTTKTVQRKELVSFLDTYLNIKTVSDDSWNGLQVQGKEAVTTIVTAVDAGMETFQKAKELGADMIIVHHGMFWQNGNPCLFGPTLQRCEFLLNHGISLYAAHLPLDLHPEVGNNAQLLKILGFEKDQPFCKYHGQTISFTGITKKPTSRDNLVAILSKQLGAQCRVLPFGKEMITRIAVCSGGGAAYPLFQEALDAGADLYLTGDNTELYHAAKDNNFNIIFAGHHATEIVGVRALGELLTQKFGIKTQFLDIPTQL